MSDSFSNLSLSEIKEILASEDIISVLEEKGLSFRDVFNQLSAMVRGRVETSNEEFDYLGAIEQIYIASKIYEDKLKNS